MLAAIYTICLILIFIMLCLNVVNALAGKQVVFVPGGTELIFSLIALALFLPRVHG